MHITVARRRGAFAMLAVLVTLLLLSVFMQIWALPAEVWGWVSNYPLLEPLAVPGIIWEVVSIACWQAVGLIGLRVVVLVRDRRFDRSAYGWLWVILGLLITYILLVIGAVIGLQASGFWSPVLGLVLIASAFFTLLGLTCFVIFLVTSSRSGLQLSKASQVDE